MKIYFLINSLPLRSFLAIRSYPTQFHSYGVATDCFSEGWNEGGFEFLLKIELTPFSFQHQYHFPNNFPHLAIDKDF